jgi:hypothetical protein
MGMRLCPPLKILASSPYCCRKAIASGIVFGRRYSKAGGIIFVSTSHPGFPDADEMRRIGNLPNCMDFRPGNLIIPGKVDGQTDRTRPVQLR